MSPEKLPYEGPIKFPLENQEELNSKVTFQAIRVDNLETIREFLGSNPTSADVTGSGGRPNENTESGLSDEQKQAQADAVVARAGATAGGSFKSLNTQFIDGGKVEIYMPPSLVFGDRFAYSTPDLGIVGGAALAAANNQASVGDVASAIGADVFGATKTIFDLALGTMKAASTEAAKLALARLSKADFRGTGDAVSIGFRVTVAPNTRARFQNVGLRRFTFDFKFIPKSAAEAVAVENLVKFFRYHAYPSTISDPNTNIPLTYDYPDMFKIKLLYNKASNQGGRRIFKPIGQQIKLCYLESINTVHNPTSAVFHSDGYPVETNLSLNFMEYRTLTRSDLQYDGTDFDPDLTNALATRGNI